MRARARTVRIARLDAAIFFAEVVPDGGAAVDARPSDALVLAPATGVRIEVERDVLAATRGAAPDEYADGLSRAAQRRRADRELRADLRARPSWSGCAGRRRVSARPRRRWPLPITPVDVGFPYWMGTWLGVFPTWESLSAQAVAMTIVFGSYFLAEELRVKRPRRRALREQRTREAASRCPAACRPSCRP